MIVGTRAVNSVSVRIVQGLEEVAAASWDRCANPQACGRIESSINPLAGGADSPPEHGEGSRAAPQLAETPPIRLDAESRSEPTELAREDPDSTLEADRILLEDDPHNPFISHAFLCALEESGCVGGRTGWQPAHVLVEDSGGRLLACAPTYLKSHSQGEYVFDHAFAEAYARAGGRYYPKLQVAVPFTPVPGRRLLVGPEIDQTDGIAALTHGLDALRDRFGASSTHITFLSRSETDAVSPLGYLPRHGQQYHFANEGYRDFDEFLGALASRKRKLIRRERRDALASGITIRWKTGAEITEGDWDAFFAFYTDTGSRKWGRPYLNRQFFSLMGQAMAERILLVLAYRSGRAVAGALNLIGDIGLFGRNWGCVEDHPFLHFEVCYYQAIEFAIARGLRRVEAGAQGDHKLARGYRPVITYSAHNFVHPGLKRAVADFLANEREYVNASQEELDMMTPFRRE